jgi:hypothetical protein
MMSATNTTLPVKMPITVNDFPRYAELTLAARRVTPCLMSSSLRMTFMLVSRDSDPNGLVPLVNQVDKLTTTL